MECNALKGKYRRVMAKVSHIVIEGTKYDVQHLTADTLDELVEDLPRYELNAVLKKYHVKKSS